MVRPRVASWRIAPQNSRRPATSIPVVGSSRMSSSGSESSAIANRSRCCSPPEHLLTLRSPMSETPARFITESTDAWWTKSEPVSWRVSRTVMSLSTPGADPRGPADVVVVDVMSFRMAARRGGGESPPSRLSHDGCHGPGMRVVSSRRTRTPTGAPSARSDLRVTRLAVRRLRTAAHRGAELAVEAAVHRQHRRDQSQEADDDEDQGESAVRPRTEPRHDRPRAPSVGHERDDHELGERPDEERRERRGRLLHALREPEDPALPLEGDDLLQDGLFGCLRERHEEDVDD